MKPQGWNVFAVDPGDTCGWAWACVGRRDALHDPATGGMRAALHQGRVRFGQERVFHDSGPEGSWADETRCAKAILTQMLKCQGIGATSSSGVVPEISTLVIEDFILRERTKERSLLSPVRLTARIETLLFDEPELSCKVHYQSPSDAKSTVTDERLERWGFWPTGAPHARDALRHLLMFMREANGS